MKEIKAYLRPHMMDAVVDALESLPDIPGVTLSRVEGWGHARDSGTPQITDRMKLEIVVPDERVDGVVALITAEARTGRTGDGKIFVSTVDDAIRIRTGERGRSAVRPSEQES